MTLAGRGSLEHLISILICRRQCEPSAAPVLESIGICRGSSGPQPGAVGVALLLELMINNLGHVDVGEEGRRSAEDYRCRGAL